MPMNQILTPVLYLDLDDTVRMGKDTLGKFVNGPEDVEVFPEVPDLLQTYKDLGWRIVACSNQGGIALGIMSIETCMAALNETQAQCRGLFDKVGFCPHHPNADEQWKTSCWCRKPSPGLVIQAAIEMGREHEDELYCPYLGLFVGDRPEDEACAKAASLNFLEAKAWRKGTHLDLLLAAQ
jgi:D-glycero-D-manno-heptose 1,7-bisphosphate phosphatase